MFKPPTATLSKVVVAVLSLNLQPAIADDPLAGYRWAAATPAGLAGEFYDVDEDVRGNGVLLAATPGGVYRSTNRGASWTSMSSGISFPSITAIAQDPRPDHHDTWYALTRHFANDVPGKGVYRSDDNAESWVRVSGPEGSTVSGAVGDIVVDAAGVVFLTGRRGISRSTDQGVTWENALTSTDSIYYSGIAVTSAGILASFTTTLDLERFPEAVTDGTPPARGIHLSTDSGRTWTQLTSNDRFERIGRLSMASDPENPAIVYAQGERALTHNDTPERFALYRIDTSSRVVDRQHPMDVLPRHYVGFNTQNGMLVTQGEVFIGGSRLLILENDRLREPMTGVDGIVTTILSDSPFGQRSLLTAGRGGVALFDAKDETVLRPLGYSPGAVIRDISQSENPFDANVAAGNVVFEAREDGAGLTQPLIDISQPIENLSWLGDNSLIVTSRGEQGMEAHYVHLSTQQSTPLPLPTASALVVVDPETETALAYDRGLYWHPDINALIEYGSTHDEFPRGSGFEAGWQTVDTGTSFSLLHDVTSVGNGRFVVLAGERAGSGLSIVEIDHGDAEVRAVGAFAEFEKSTSFSIAPDNPSMQAALIGQASAHGLILDPKPWASEDGGETWERVTPSFEHPAFDGLTPSFNVIQPLSNGVLLGTSHGLYWTSGDVTRWIAPDVIGLADVAAISVRGSDGRIVVGTAGNGVFTGRSAPIATDPASPGLYFDPERVGHGFAVRNFVDGTAGTYLFSFDETGESEWLLALGVSQSGIISVGDSGPLRYSMGSDQVVAREVVPFADLLWDQTLTGMQPQCTEAVARVRTSIDGEELDWCVNGLLNSEDFASGVWYAGQEDSGWGLTVDVQGGTIVVIAYLYDAQGRPVWLLGQSDSWSDGEQIPMRKFEGYCRSCLAAEISSSAAGELSLTRLGDQLNLDMDVLAGSLYPRQWVRSQTGLTRLGN